MSIQSLLQRLGSNSTGLLSRSPSLILFISTIAVPLTLVMVAEYGTNRLRQTRLHWEFLAIFLLLLIGLSIGYLRFRRTSHRLLANDDYYMTMPRKRILWVEGDEDQREVVNFILVQSGFSITSVDNSFEAISLAKIEYFDLYLLGDWEPFGKESKLCDQLNRLTPKHPVLFYSAAAKPTDRLRGLGAGAQCYLTKLVGLDTLLEAVKHLLSNNRNLIGTRSQ